MQRMNAELELNLLRKFTKDSKSIGSMDSIHLSRSGFASFFTHLIFLNFVRALHPLEQNPFVRLFVGIKSSNLVPKIPL
jgi:hypothetical protein